MFERYTERARRALFFARYEASALGGATLDSEHLLLGLMRSGKGLTSELFDRAQLRLDEVRSDVRARIPPGDKIPPTVEIPFSPAARRLLEAAEAESVRLGHNHIGTEHLLLGLLSEPDTVAARILIGRGVDRDSVRREIAREASSTRR